MPATTTGAPSRDTSSIPFCALLCALGILISPALVLADESSVTLGLGRLHPAVVHFPIAFLLLAMLVEMFQWIKGRALSASGMLLLWSGALSALVAATFGWWNAAHTEFHGTAAETVTLHRWSGVGVAVCSLLLAVGCALPRLRDSTTWLRTVRVGLLLLGALIGFSAHHGGILVHGEDYYDPLYALVRIQEAGTVEVAHTRQRDEASPVAFSAATLPEPYRGALSYPKDIHPIFEANCGKCHLNGKAKGDFQLDSRDLILRGGESGPAAVPGDSAKSLMIELVSGFDPERVMPNKGRRLSAKEISKLRAWIDGGMSFEGAAMPTHVFAKADPRPRVVKIPEDAPPEHTHPIDRVLWSYFSAKGISPGGTVDDRGFIRRAYLDLVGVVPLVEEIEQFVADRSEHKRAELVDRLLSDDRGYATHWLSFWNDLLRNDYSGPGYLYGKRMDMSPWLFSALARNMPLDLMVQALLKQEAGAEGFLRGILWWKDGFVNIVEDRAMQAAQNVSQVFMGVNLKCASCHNSFTDAWSLNDAYAMVNVFAFKPFETHRCNLPQGRTQRPAFLYPELGEIPEKGRKKRIETLAEVLTSPQNGRFARTFVNRVWHRLMGVGIVEPVDELDQNPWHADLLDYLANEFVSNEYDIRRLLRVIMTSRAYQLPSTAAFPQMPKDYVFAGPAVRRLNAEQFIDSLARIGNATHRVSHGDVERILKVMAKEPKQIRERSILGSPRILFSSGKIDPIQDTVAFDVPLQDVRTLWILLLPRFNFPDKEDAERKRRELIGTQNKSGGATPTIVEYYRARLNRTRVEKADGGAVPIEKLEWFEAVGTQLYDYTAAMEPTPDQLHGLIARTSGQVSLTLASEFGVRPIAGAAFRIENLRATRFRGELSFERLQKRAKHRYELVIAADIRPQAVFLEATDLLLALGRPRREQVATTRSAFASTVEGLELQRSDELMTLLRRSAKRLTTVLPQEEGARIQALFRLVLGRSPSDRELQITRESQRGLAPQEAIEDLLWALLMSPEFQLIV